MLWDCRPVCPVQSVCDVGVLCPNSWTDQDETRHVGNRLWPWPHCVRWGASSPFPKEHIPQFLAHILCRKMAGWIKMPPGREVGLGPSDIVLAGDPAPLPKKGQSPQFSAHVCWGQTAVWIKIPLGMEVGLGTGHIMLDGDAAPLPKKGAHPRQFSGHIYCGQTVASVSYTHLTLPTIYSV